MKPINEMTIEEISDELLETYRLPKSSLSPEAKDRATALETRYDELLTKVRNGARIINPDEYDEGQG